jgi:hypothetical protein
MKNKTKNMSEYRVGMDAASSNKDITANTYHPKISEVG